MDVKYFCPPNLRELLPAVNTPACRPHDVSLKRLELRVLCIDRDRVQTDHGFTMTMPAGAEDFTGDLPLVERLNVVGVGGELSRDFNQRAHGALGGIFRAVSRRQSQCLSRLPQ